MSREEEKQLIALARAGDEIAWETIVRRNQNSVRSPIKALLRDYPQEWDELTSETFLRAHRSLQDFRGDSAISTWLRRIALNLAVDRLRVLQYDKSQPLNEIHLDTVGCDGLGRPYNGGNPEAGQRRHNGGHPDVWSPFFADNHKMSRAKRLSELLEQAINAELDSATEKRAARSYFHEGYTAEVTARMCGIDVVRRIYDISRRVSRRYERLVMKEFFPQPVKETK